MSLVREPGSEIVAQFNVPLKGTLQSIAAHTVPADAVYDSLNVFIREGKLRNRPGLLLHDDTIFAHTILGGAMAVTPQEHIILAITRSEIYQLSDVSSTWSILPAPAMTVFANNDNSVIDIAFLETSGTYVALIAERSQVLKAWIATPRSVETITGTNIPRATSICIAASRVIALVSPHTVVWSKVLDHTVYDALAYAKRAQTGDEGVCVESLSALSFVLYKERSIHTARAQAGIDEATAFAFSEPLYVEGPAGIYAVVNIGGSHMYMTKNGRIALFNGTSYPTWIGDGIWLFLQNDIEPSAAYKIRGVYDYRLHTVTFFYPKKGYLLGLQGIVIVCLPLEGTDLQPVTHHCFLGKCEKPVSHACEKRFNPIIDRSLIFTQASGTVNDAQPYIFDESVVTDGDMLYNCSFQTGLQPMPDAVHKHFTVEVFAERQFGYGTVVIEPVLSDMLESKSGVIPESSAQHINLEVNPIREYIGFGYQARFVGLRYSWRSDSTVRYGGSVIYASQQDRFKR